MLLLPYPCRRCSPTPLTRRAYLRQLGAGFASVALTGLLAEEKQVAAASTQPANPLTPKPPHFGTRAKRVIMLFMDGGPSHHDLFDFKPLLVRDNGQPLPFKLPRVLSNADRFGNLLAPLAKFHQRGQSGVWMSDLLPNLAEVADDLCVIHSLHCSNPQHGAACLEWHTGSATFVRPSLGSWLTYGLGSENQNLPGYITMCQPLASGGVGLYGSAFLPAAYQGTPLGYERMSAKEAKFRYIDSQHARPKLQQMELDLLREMGRDHLDMSGPDSALEARIDSFELAFRMQIEAPEVQDISEESAATHALYGLDDKAAASFGQQCLLARRFVERGVRFVQCNLGGWDHHYNLRAGLPANARQMDKPIAGLIQDLKSRGLLDETLVVWGGEFGRTPVAEGGNGRDHNPYGYTMWLAGGGVHGGLTYGQTDDYGFHAIENKVHVHDLHATILHLLGLDHEKLTYPYAGRNFRLTDVEGRVVHEIMA
jgi:hypothetical protein